LEAVKHIDRFRKFGHVHHPEPAIVEIDDESYDFASGLMKAWWKKYYA
jgi:hypothetical protein